MAKIIPIAEHYQHFLAEIKESFWGDVCGFGHGEELGLVLADMLRSQAIGREVEVLSETLDEASVTLCGSLRVIESNDVAGVLPASFCADGSQGHLLVAPTYLS